MIITSDQFVTKWLMYRDTYTSCLCIDFGSQSFGLDKQIVEIDKTPYMVFNGSHTKLVDRETIGSLKTR